MGKGGGTGVALSSQVTSPALSHSYIWQHIEIGYVQGMCDLLAPLLVILDDGEWVALLSLSLCGGICWGDLPGGWWPFAVEVWSRILFVCDAAWLPGAHPWVRVDFVEELQCPCSPAMMPLLPAQRLWLSAASPS